MATVKQVKAATDALGISWARIVTLCRADFAEHGVLTEAGVQALTRTEAYRLGDLVAVRGHGRYRAARVWKVSRRSARVSAMYLTPSSLAESRVCAPTLCNATGVPLGLLAASSDRAPSGSPTR